MENTLGRRITANRKRLGLTQDQLAEKLGLTAQAVSKWENDLSCPDISILPKLADIFGVTTDELLGRETEVPVCETELIAEKDSEENGFVYDDGKMDFHWEGAKIEGIGLACWVLLTGILYLVTRLVHIDVSFWNILWPSFLFVFGIFGLFPKFSAFRLGCALVGGYFLVGNLQILSIELDNGIILAVVILLFGLSLLADALQKYRKRKYPIGRADEKGKAHYEKATHDYNVDGNAFTYDVNFGTSTQKVQMAKLRSGNISTNFGEYTVDLTGVAELENPCNLHADCSFGELTILVPRHFNVVPDSSTSFASFEIIGNPDSNTQGTIYLNAVVSFGEICIRYL